MNKSDIKILIDVDDTIEDLIPAWIDWLNSQYNLNVKYEEVDCWEIYKKYPSLTQEQVYEPLFIDNFWKTVRTKPDAIEYVQKLALEGYDLYLCTNSNLETIKKKKEYIIDKYFPYLKDKIIIISNKQMLRADFLIDDNPANLLGGDYRKILFSCYHNQGLSKRKKDQMYLITNSWKEIFDSIENFSKISMLYS